MRKDFIILCKMMQSHSPKKCPEMYTSGMDYVLCHGYDYGESKIKLPFGGNPDCVNPHCERGSHKPDKINEYGESKIELPFFANSDGVNPHCKSGSHKPEKINKNGESKIKLPFFGNSDGVNPHCERGCHKPDKNKINEYGTRKIELL